MNTEILASAIVGHLVGDYLLQNDWMALNKKQNPLICMVHCTLWTASVCLFAGWSDLWIVGALLCAHFIQDNTNVVLWWMKLKWKDQSKFAQPPCAPWSIIVVDNVWHILTIYLIWRFLV